MIRNPGNDLLTRLVSLTICLAASHISVGFTNAAPGDNPKTVGKVLDMQGSWYFFDARNSETKLDRWQRIPAGGAIRIKEPERADFIVIANPENGKIVENRRCSEVGACERPIYLEPSTDSESIGSRTKQVVSEILDRLWEDPMLFSRHRSRDIDEGSGPDLDDGIARLQHGQLDLSMILREFPKGRYYLHFRKLTDSKSKSPEIGPLTIDWDGAKASVATDRQITAGVYDAGLLMSIGQDFKKVGELGRVLVCSANHYEVAMTSFQRSVALTETWKQQVSPATIQSFLRADLSELAETVCGAAK